MSDDLPTLFRLAHAAIGDEIVPKGYDNIEFLWELSPVAEVNAVARGIVHTLRWLAKNEQGYCPSTIIGAKYVEHSTNPSSRPSEPHDGTPASLYAALLRLATRVAQEKTNA